MSCLASPWPVDAACGTFGRKSNHSSITVQGFLRQDTSSRRSTHRKRPSEGLLSKHRVRERIRAKPDILSTTTLRQLGMANRLLQPR